jgi:hypothetical protein
VVHSFRTHWHDDLREKLFLQPQRPESTFSSGECKTNAYEHKRTGYQDIELDLSHRQMLQQRIDHSYSTFSSRVSSAMSEM